jgi:hypothetical protein
LLVHSLLFKFKFPFFFFSPTHRLGREGLFCLNKTVRETERQMGFQIKRGRGSLCGFQIPLLGQMWSGEGRGELGQWAGGEGGAQSFVSFCKKLFNGFVFPYQL